MEIRGSMMQHRHKKGDTLKVASGQFTPTSVGRVILSDPEWSASAYRSAVVLMPDSKIEWFVWTDNYIVECSCEICLKNCPVVQLNE